MNINKTIKKQKKSFNRFVFLMVFIFVFLPVFLFVILNKINYLHVFYLFVLNSLILIQIIIRTHENYLKYKKNYYKLTIKDGLFKSKYNIISEKVVFVHAEDLNENMKIIILTSSRFRNKNFKEVNLEFLKNHPYAAKYCNRLKENNPENKYYYIQIIKGRSKKYKLLNEIYISCPKAIFSQHAIERVKEYRI